MENYQAELQLETEHLARIIALAEQQLRLIRQSSGQHQAELAEAKRELWDNTSHSVSNLWSRDNFYELAALSQYANQVSNKISTLEQEANKLLALERMTQVPYFARIDFCFAEGGQTEQVYIGRSSLLDEQTMQFHVYDWRSPLAGVFYRFGVGEAHYDAPRGRIEGQLRLKRQFEINRGQLDFFFDADVQIMDEFLKKLLAQNASSKMKAIVETIQKDQDQIIRDLENDLMMVQGVAGSGKTSVALHRVAYLMYQGLANKLAAHNILILSPNTLFERYISNVLPELGEDNVVTVTFEKILQDLLPEAPIQSKNQLLEHLIGNADREQSRLRKSALAFKTSAQFKRILERFLEDIPRRWISFSNVSYDGQLIAERSQLQAEILSRPAEPLLVRLGHLEKALWEKIHTLQPERLQKLREQVAQQEQHVFEIKEYARLLSIEESTALYAQIQGFTQLDVPALYQELFRDPAYFRSLGEGLELPPELAQILQLSLENLQQPEIPYEDALALAYLQLRLQGFHRAQRIKQVVIDEAQDYYPLHFELLRLLFPQARYTILGDLQQTIEKPADPGLFAEIQQILAKPKAALVSMEKSFRCTREILAFSQQFLPPGTRIESFSRAGEIPQIHTAPDAAALDLSLLREITACQAAGYQSVGLLCKTEAEARALYERLQAQVGLQFIASDTVRDIQGVCVLPLYMAKGLEFDAVLLCDVDDQHYATEDDQKLLYIGCTRALHRLSLFYTGKQSALLRQEGGRA